MNASAAAPSTVPDPLALSRLAESDEGRPAFHLRPHSGWMNDLNGTISLDGWHQVFYQYCPGSEQEGPKHWGHARSRDLVDWEHLPVALSPDTDQGEEGVWSGGAATAEDGTPILIYTAFTTPGTDGKRRFRQVAVACDRGLTRFDRLPGPLVATDADPAYRGDARDPFLFRAEGRTWMVHGAIHGSHSVVLLHEAVDGSLRRWRHRGELLRRPLGLVPFCECPNMIAVGDRWLLLLSPYAPVEGFLGRFSEGNFTVEREVRLDHHDAFYGSNVLSDVEGAPVLMAWVRGWTPGHGWNGCASAPRRVLTDDRAGIRQEILPSWLAGLVRGTPQSWSGTLTDEVRDLDTRAGDQLLVDLILERDPSGSLLCEIGCDADGNALTVAWRGDRLVVAGQATVLTGVGQRCELRLLVDRSLLEVFADGGRTVVTRIQRRKNRGTALRLTSTGSVRIDAHWQSMREAVFTGEG